VAVFASAVCSAGCGLAALPASAGATPVPRGFVGMMVDGPLFPSTADGIDLDNQFNTMVASGVENVRAVFDWSYAQPYEDWNNVPPAISDEFTNVGGIPTRFGLTDELVELAAEHGMTVLPLVMYAPKWDAAPHPPNSVPTPKRDAPYAAYAAALVRRYGPHGTFWETHSPAVPIRDWQIWNEPNINVYWTPEPFQPRYVALLHAAHDAIKRVDRGAKIVLAGLPNYSWEQLGKIYAIKGARKWFDIVAVHPYTRDPSGVITIIGKVRQVMNEHGDRSKGILASEISWPSSLGKTNYDTGYDFATTEAGQARKISQILPLLGKNRRSLGILGFDYYTWAGSEQHNTLAFNFSGLFRFHSGAFKTKPAFGAFRKGALALENCKHKGSIATVCTKPG
jgi:hypothetical protein